MKKVTRVVIAIIAIVILSIGIFSCNSPDEVIEKNPTASVQSGDMNGNVTGTTY